MVIYKMQDLYKMALLEGEGLGTAYEYYVKLRLLNKFLKNNTVKNVLIYGLPEKYGYSLDFFYFCKKNNLNVFLFEKRKEKINRLEEILDKLKEQNINFEMVNKIDKKYDLVLNCEVLQSLKKDEFEEFIENINKYSKKAFIFVPNKSNKYHIKFSCLAGFRLKELNFLFNNVKESGYIDMPPFPPGIKKGKKIKSHFFIKLIEVFTYLEMFTPLIIKKRFAHINYVLIINE